VVTTKGELVTQTLRCRSHHFHRSVLLLLSLFYTDAVGTLMVFAMYERTLAGRDWMTSVCCAVAIVCRQTNVVWVVF
jgi:hypothetical protein